MVCIYFCSLAETQSYQYYLAVLRRDTYRLTWLRTHGADAKAMGVLPAFTRGAISVNWGYFCDHGLLGQYGRKWPRLRYVVPDSHGPADSSGPEFHCFRSPSTVLGSRKAVRARLLHRSRLKSPIPNSVARACPLRRQRGRAPPGQRGPS